jgi:hypothetical protein
MDANVNNCNGMLKYRIIEHMHLYDLGLSGNSAYLLGNHIFYGFSPFPPSLSRQRDESGCTVIFQWGWNRAGLVVSEEKDSELGSG